MNQTLERKILNTAASMRFPFVEATLYAFYGLMTNTEFSGTGIHRSLSEDWAKAVNKEASAIDPTTLIAHEKELFDSPPACQTEQHRLRTIAVLRMHNAADKARKGGMSTYDAQLSVIKARLDP